MWLLLVISLQFYGGKSVATLDKFKTQEDSRRKECFLLVREELHMETHLQQLTKDFPKQSA